MLEIVAAQTEAQYRQLRVLFAEHGDWDIAQTKLLGLDSKAVRDFYYASDDQPLPGAYASPHGCALLATYEAEAAGCAAFHRMTPEICEMKRMYVRPQFRGMHIGKRLAGHLITAARGAGYGQMRLETTTFMDKAIMLYSSLGFRACQPYYEIPESFRAMTVFMERDLADGR